VRYAINIDPVQFSVYAAPWTGLNWQENLLPSATISSPQAAALYSTGGTLSATPLADALTWVVTVAANGTDSLYSAQPSTVLGGSSLRPPQYNAWQPLLPPSSSAVSFLSMTALQSAQSPWIALSTPTTLLLFSPTLSSPSSISLALNASYALPTGNPVLAVSPLSPSSPLCSTGPQCAFVLALDSSSCPTGGLSLTLQSLSPTPSPPHTLASLCVPAPSSTPVTSATLALLEPLQSILLSYTSNGSVFAFSLSFTPSSLTLLAPSSALPLHPGDAPSAAALALPAPLFLLTWTDGFCWNTETRNKQPEPAVCDQQPVATPSVINYAVAAPANWTAFLSTPSTPTSPSLSVCDASLLLGAAGFGQSPAALLFANNSQPFLGLARLGFAGDDVSQCGPPAPFQGFALDAANLQAWWKL
jgi:hypothetical protein